MRILLLGNGFDLYHKFPTRYDNFLHTVDFLQQNYDEKTMLTIGDIFGDQRLLEKDSFIPECYAKHKEAYHEITVDQEKIKKIISLSKENIWFNYFLSVYNKELGWIDFEREISKVLYAFEEFFLCYGNVYDITFPKYDVYEYIIKRFDFFYEYTDVAVDAIGRIYGTNSDTVLDDYQLEEPYGSKIIIINKAKIIDKLYDELLKLSEILRIYLDVFINNAITIIFEKGLVPKTSLFKNDPTVITFNYTNTFETLYSGTKVRHLHGNTSDKIILGVNPDDNDEFDSKNDVHTDFLQFKKYYQRVLNATDIGYLNCINQAKEHLEIFSGNWLVVAGHSLDITDEDIIKEVFSVSNEITIVCHSEKSIADSINNLIRIYGKKEFDNIRARTNMRFKLYSDFEQ